MGVRDRGEFTSTVHGKPPELWLPSRLQRLRSRVLKITSYSTATHEYYTHTNRLDPRHPRPSPLHAFVIGRDNRFSSNPSILSLAFLPSRYTRRALRIRRPRGSETTKEETRREKRRGKDAWMKREGKIWKEGGGWWTVGKCNFENAWNRRWR